LNWGPNFGWKLKTGRKPKGLKLKGLRNWRFSLVELDAERFWKSSKDRSSTTVSIWLVWLNELTKDLLKPSKKIAADSFLF
jgi:hypothetical protein